MAVAIILIILLPLLGFAAFLTTKSGKGMRGLIRFYAAGYDSGFKTGEIALLWQTGQAAGLDDPSALFWSVPTLNKSITGILQKARTEGRENDNDIQDFLSRLYSYRTKVEFEQSKYKHGINSTRSIAEGQPLRIVLKDDGIFIARVITNSSRGMTISWPVKSDLFATGITWTNRDINVYFWRKEDAGYSFVTKVLDGIKVHGQPALVLAHTDTMVRSQKRKSIRAPCSIYGQLYLSPSSEKNPDAIETEPGLKCFIEDISEDGALIRIGGKGKAGMNIKVQFVIQDIFILMNGTVRGMEFDAEKNQSKLHFECGELNPRMKNAILSFVYNVLPSEEKNVFDAIRLAEEDVKTEESRKTEGSAQTESVL